VVGIDLQEFGFELVAAPDIAGDEVVIETQFLEQELSPSCHSASAKNADRA
jgi:hypothetical protein